jgi:hypothetical protein
MNKETINKINNNLILLVEGFEDAERDYNYDLANEKHYVSEIIALVKKLTLTDVVKSFPDLKFINLLDGELCDYKVINKICNRQDDAQDVLRKVVKEHYKIDM